MRKISCREHRKHYNSPTSSSSSGEDKLSTLSQRQLPLQSTIKYKGTKEGLEIISVKNSSSSKDTVSHHVVEELEQKLDQSSLVLDEQLRAEEAEVEEVIAGRNCRNDAEQEQPSSASTRGSTRRAGTTSKKAETPKKAAAAPAPGVPRSVVTADEETTTAPRGAPEIKKSHEVAQPRHQITGGAPSVGRRTAEERIEPSSFGRSAEGNNSSASTTFVGAGAPGGAAVTTRPASQVVEQEQSNGSSSNDRGNNNNTKNRTASATTSSGGAAPVSFSTDGGATGATTTYFNRVLTLTSAATTFFSSEKGVASPTLIPVVQGKVVAELVSSSSSATSSKASCNSSSSGSSSSPGPGGVERRYEAGGASAHSCPPGVGQQDESLTQGATSSPSFLERLKHFAYYDAIVGGNKSAAGGKQTLNLMVATQPARHTREV